MHNYFLGLRNVFNFKGKTNRKEFVHFILIQSAVAVIFFAMIIIQIVKLESIHMLRTNTVLPILVISAFAHFMFFPAIISRRLRDLNYSGWWSLASITFLLSFLSLVAYITTPYGNLPQQQRASITIVETGETMESAIQPSPIMKTLSPILYASNGITALVLFGGMSVLLRKGKDEANQRETEETKAG